MKKKISILVFTMMITSLLTSCAESKKERISFKEQMSQLEASYFEEKSSQAETSSSKEKISQLESTQPEPETSDTKYSEEDLHDMAFDLFDALDTSIDQLNDEDRQKLESRNYIYGKSGNTALEEEALDCFDGLQNTDCKFMYTLKDGEVVQTAVSYHEKLGSFPDMNELARDLFEDILASLIKIDSDGMHEMPKLGTYTYRESSDSVIQALEENLSSISDKNYMTFCYTFDDNELVETSVNYQEKSVVYPCENNSFDDVDYSNINLNSEATNMFDALATAIVEMDMEGFQPETGVYVFGESSNSPIIKLLEQKCKKYFANATNPNFTFTYTLRDMSIAQVDLECMGNTGTYPKK